MIVGRGLPPNRGVHLSYRSGASEMDGHVTVASWRLSFGPRDARPIARGYAGRSPASRRATGRSDPFFACRALPRGESEPRGSAAGGRRRPRD